MCSSIWSTKQAVFTSALISLLLACVDATPTDIQSTQSIAALEIVSGDEQFGNPGEMLPEPLIVRVLDADSLPVQGRAVNFHVVAGGGSVFAGVGITDANGVAQERWILGPDTMQEQRVEARAVSSETGEPLVLAQFTAWATGDSGELAISEMTVASGRPYQIVDGLAAGMTAYIDRSYTIVDPVPTPIQGQTFIRTANADKNANPGSTMFLRFTVNQDVLVYVGHDDRVARPAWLGSFVDTGVRLAISDADTRLTLFSRTFPAGTVTLGSNTSTAGTSASMYVVIIQTLVGTDDVHR